MLFFTHSYDKKKQFIQSLDSDIFFDGIYVNKLHTISRNPLKTLSEYDSLNIPIIYESPLYVSSYWPNLNNEDVIQRKLEKELLDSTKNFGYMKNKDLFVADVIDKWNAYLKAVPKIINLKTVLSLPCWKNLNKDAWTKLLNSTPSDTYDYVSFAIDTDQFGETERLFKIADTFAKKMRTNNILFTIKSDYELSALPRKTIQQIKTEILKSPNNIILHHCDWILPILDTQVSYSFGIDNQTKTLFKSQRPFTEKQNGGLPRKKSIWMSEISSTISIDKGKSFLMALSQSELNDPYISKLNTLLSATSSKVTWMDEITLNNREIKKLIKRTYADSLTSFDVAEYVLGNNWSMNPKSIINSIDGRKYKKAL